jgi:hypothetical protein
MKNGETPVCANSAVLSKPTTLTIPASRSRKGFGSSGL